MVLFGVVPPPDAILFANEKSVKQAEVAAEGKHARAPNFSLTRRDVRAVRTPKDGSGAAGARSRGGCPLGGTRGAGGRRGKTGGAERRCRRCRAERDEPRLSALPPKLRRGGGGGDAALAAVRVWGRGEETSQKRCALTPSIFVAEVGKPPDVGQVHGEADDGEEEVDLLAPGLPVLGAVARGGGGGQEAAGGVLHPVVLLHQDQLHVLPRGRRPRALRQGGHHRHFAVGLDLFVHPCLKHPERSELRRGSGRGGVGERR